MHKHKIIYVTGITGFIGSNLLHHLLQKYNKVVNFTRHKTLKIYEKDRTQEVDITNDFFLQNPSNAFINLATLYNPNPSSVYELENLIEANIHFPASVFSALDSLENLKIVNALSYHQLLDFKAQNVYSLSKELFKKFLDHQHSEIVNLYIFDTFGSGDTRNKVVDMFIKNIIAGNSISIPLNEIRINLSDVQPLCRSLIKSIDLPQGSYSLKSSDTISLEDLAKMIMEISNKKVDILKVTTGSNYFDEIEIFPENIFLEDPSYNLGDSIKNRIKELEDAI
ncbi:NAD-dependent epimerase/dehydratase family protein [Gammaproteobacteria bacterium]|nr:NAD-dependent epimerase/dehydratase family protein [Gammaproteobacteria bacterium]